MSDECIKALEAQRATYAARMAAMQDIEMLRQELTAHIMHAGVKAYGILQEARLRPGRVYGFARVILEESGAALAAVTEINSRRRASVMDAMGCEMGGATNSAQPNPVESRLIERGLSIADMTDAELLQDIVLQLFHVRTHMDDVSHFNEQKAMAAVEENLQNIRAYLRHTLVCIAEFQRRMARYEVP